VADVLEDDFRAAAERGRGTERGAEETRRELRRLVLLAANEGLPVTLISRLTQRSRETIYRDLERARREERQDSQLVFALLFAHWLANAITMRQAVGSFNQVR
jgi:hypothetical protein